MKKNIQRQSYGFSLNEVLIVMALIAILILVGIAILNPRKQIERIWDVKRKQELAILLRVFDDYLNDKQAYPRDTDVCYDRALFDPDTNSCYCHICGLESSNNPFKNYLQSIYCDPQHPTKDYLYQYDCSAGEDPKWFRICANLSWPEVSLQPGNYNYGVSSPNRGSNYCYSIPIANPADAPADELPLITPTPTSAPGGISITPTPTDIPGSSSPTPTPTSLIPSTTAAPTPTSTPFPQSGPPLCPNDPLVKYCKKVGFCNVCGDQFNCHDERSCDQPVQLYSDYQCSLTCL